MLIIINKHIQQFAQTFQEKLKEGLYDKACTWMKALEYLAMMHRVLS